VSDEIPGKIGEFEDDNFMIEFSGSVAQPISTKHYKVIAKEQYESELKKAYFSGWEDRNDCELREIIHKRKATKEDYFKWFMEEKERVEPKVIFDDDDGEIQ
jgi:hypothetical protein